jgi:phosphatidylglycerophosphate synthase
MLLWQMTAFQEGCLIFLVCQFRYILDCTDGALARTTNRTSSFGAVYDKVADVAGNQGPALILVAIEATRHPLTSWQALALIAAFMAGMMQHVAGWLKDSERKRIGPPPDPYGSNNWSVAKITLHLTDVPLRFTFMSVAWALGWFWLFMAASACLAALKLCGFLVKSKKDMAKWDQNQRSLT